MGKDRLSFDVNKKRSQKMLVFPERNFKFC